MRRRAGGGARAASAVASQDTRREHSLRLPATMIWLHGELSANDYGAQVVCGVKRAVIGGQRDGAK
jgi:hypothetical protein